MTPRERAALIARAKRAALPLANGVRASNARAIALAIGPLSGDEKDALLLVLAEAVDLPVLAAVCAVPDDGRPVPLERPESPQERAERLRKAHAKVRMLRNAGEPIPAELCELEREYQRDVKQQQRQEAREAA